MKPAPVELEYEYHASQVASVPMVAPPDAALDPAARDLIVFSEVTNEANYRQRLQYPTWPGGSSGITIGIGYDCGYNTRAQIVEDWRKLMEVERLAAVAGKTGGAAKGLLSTVDDILVPWELAVEVFDGKTVPKWIQATNRTFPGFDRLCPAAQGALVSLVYNRGTSLVGDSRVDMRDVAEAVPKQDYRAIARAIRHMNQTMGAKWRSQGVYAGLSARREAEAKLVESCAAGG